jgi:capsular polysaccharide biosynthesis protein
MSANVRSTSDPEAEQEVDFGRYWRLIAARWWLLAAGLIVGAIVGYGLSLGSSQVFRATATVYLGQPYSASGNVQLQAAQTNPSTVRAIVGSDSVIQQVAALCKARPSDFRGGISTQSLSGNIAKNGQTPLVSITVQAAKRRKAACAANGLAKIAVDKSSGFANQKIANFSAQVTNFERRINAATAALQTGKLSTTDKLVLQIQLSSWEDAKLSTSQLLLQAKQVEKPSVLTAASAQKVTARSRRNTVVVSALIGLIIGAIAALAWDRIAAGFSRRRVGI